MVTADGSMLIIQARTAIGVPRSVPGSSEALQSAAFGREAGFHGSSQPPELQGGS